MNKIILVAMMMASVTASAIPRDLYLASPTKIEVDEDRLTLTLSLPCKNQWADEWAGNLVVNSDDEGDMALSLAVVLSLDSCERSAKQDFKLVYSLKKEIKRQSLIDSIHAGEVELVPASLAKTNIQN